MSLEKAGRRGPWFRMEWPKHARKKKAVLASILLSVSPVLSSSLAGQGKWMQAGLGTYPPARFSSAMAYDFTRGRTVLFGGGGRVGGRITIFNDTWEWDGKRWVRVPTTSGPAGRSGHAMAYDISRKKTVLFGGSVLVNGKWVNTSETWEWDGKNWVRINPSISPPARSGHAMAYDVSRKKTVLFGGWNGSGTRPVLYSDTWEWDGKNWVKMAPSRNPPPRGGHAMAYDFTRRRVVIFGGSGSYGSFSCRSGTWEWDGKNWTRGKSSLSPPGRYGAAMAFDFRRNTMVLFGGLSNQGMRDDTWLRKGTEWVPLLHAGGPIRRALHVMAFDAGRGEIVLFGGYNFEPNTQFGLADTWLISLAPAAGFKAAGQGCLGSNGKVPQLKAGSLPRIGGEMVPELLGAPPFVTTFLSVGLQASSFDLGPFGARGCSLFNNPDFLFPNRTNSSGRWTALHRFRVPGDVNLLGGVFYLQVLLADPQANRLGISVSNGARARIGF